MDADRIEKTCTGLERHGNGICQAKDGSICPYWSIGATCSRQMTSDAIFVIRGLLAENEQLKEKQTRWISVNDAMPDDYREVWVWTNGHLIDFGCHQNDYWSLNALLVKDKDNFVTHWQYKMIPEPPKEGEA